MDASKDKIKAALLEQLIGYMGKSIVSGLAEPEEAEEPTEVSIEVGPEMEDSEEEDSMDKMDSKTARLKKLKAMAQEC